MSQPPDDDENPQPYITVGHMDNLPLLREIGNMRMDVRQHYRALTTLYWELRTLTRPAPALVAHKFVDIEHQQYEQTGLRLAALKTVVGS